jgi:outer membrane protein OmpA-like peptidoglycan-associated protein
VVDDVRRRAKERGRETAEPRPASARTALADLADSAEGRYLTGPGKPMYRQVNDLQDQKAEAAVKARESQGTLRHAESTDKEQRASHRGGGRSWLLRLLIPVAVLAEAVTAYAAMESLVASRPLAAGLAVSAALAAAGMASILADRRLSRLPVPATARILEGIFVAILMVLSYDSLCSQGVGVLAAAGGAALAVLISALGLLGIEQTVVETRTFGIFLSTLRVSWKRWRSAAAATRLTRIQARTEAVADRMQRHFFGFLLHTDGLPFDQARSRAAALLQSVTHGDNASALAKPTSTAGYLVPAPNTGRRVLITAVTAAAAAALAATAFLMARPAGDANRAARPHVSRPVLTAPLSPATGLPSMGRSVPTYSVQSAVTFASGQSQLSKSAQAALRPMVTVINSLPGSLVEVDGYADDLGTAVANLKLSQERAQAVAVFLEALGARASRLVTVGNGDQGQIAAAPAGTGEALSRGAVIFIEGDSGPA